MRQKTQTEDDAKFRAALENMRYKACTPTDISFLRTLISNPMKTGRSITSENFRNTSIILTYNKHKDVVNKMGCERFAAETKQTLTYFYSDDQELVYEDWDTARASGRKKRRTNKKLLTPSLQKELWNQPHSYCDQQIAGRLDLCKGMPVMIRHNSATELSITKGQEGHVYGWKASVGLQGQQTLDVLFIKLHNPPSTIHFEGLPENVIPITKRAVRVECRLSDDTHKIVSRTQVPVLPNFAMTDYASQGKTRPWNVVDINSSRNFRAIYTSLSRSSSAAGTLIFQGFNSDIISGGIKSGGYRQELRELELLDEITQLRYVGKLPPGFAGETRSSILKNFRKQKGPQYLPPKIHPAVSWSGEQPFRISDEPAMTWEIVSTSTGDKSQKAYNKGNFKAVNQSKNSQKSEGKRKAPETGFDVNEPQIKKHKTSTHPNIITNSIQPLHNKTLVWSENSCSYDSVMMLLFHVYLTKRESFDSESTNNISLIYSNLTDAFKSDIPDLSEARNTLRAALINLRPDLFQMGAYAAVEEVINQILQTDQPFLKKKIACSNGHLCKNWTYLPAVMMETFSQAYNSTQAWASQYKESGSNRCHFCTETPQHIYEFTCFPKFFLMAVPYENVDITIINKNIHIQIEQQTNEYTVSGIIYYGQGHFITRMFHEDSQWIYDGIVNSLPQPYDSHSDSDLNHFLHKNVKIVLYVMRLEVRRTRSLTS
jgi:hypothetical protein